jgi:hypothetical protein
MKKIITLPSSVETVQFLASFKFTGISCVHVLPNVTQKYVAAVEVLLRVKDRILW